MKRLLLYIWELPQNLLAAFLVLCYDEVRSFDHHGRTVHVTRDISGGVSLGGHIFLKPDHRGNVKDVDVAHEYGHCRQSRILGWLYLPTVGIVSGLRCWLNLYKPGRYFDGWPENWADRLGGVGKTPGGQRYA